MNPKISSTAARYGQFEILKWLYENNCEWDEKTTMWAAYEGHLDILKWLVEKNCPWNESVCSSAAENNHFDVLKWVRENGIKPFVVTKPQIGKKLNFNLFLLIYARYGYIICIRF